MCSFSRLHDCLLEAGIFCLGKLNDFIGFLQRVRSRLSRALLIRVFNYIDPIFYDPETDQIHITALDKDSEIDSLNEFVISDLESQNSDEIYRTYHRYSEEVEEDLEDPYPFHHRCMTRSEYLFRNGQEINWSDDEFVPLSSQPSPANSELSEMPELEDIEDPAYLYESGELDHYPENNTDVGQYDLRAGYYNIMYIDEDGSQ